MKKNYNKKLGKLGEEIACRYYQKLGWQIVCKNYLSRYGEIDLVLKKNRKILVVEVKTRSNLSYGWPEEAIDNKKINNIYTSYQILRRTKKLAEFFQLEICLIYLKNKVAKIKIIRI